MYASKTVEKSVTAILTAIIDSNIRASRISSGVKPLEKKMFAHEAKTRPKINAIILTAAYMIRYVPLSDSMPFLSPLALNRI